MSQEQHSPQAVVARIVHLGRPQTRRRVAAPPTQEGAGDRLGSLPFRSAVEVAEAARRRRPECAAVTSGRAVAPAGTYSGKVASSAADAGT